MSNKTSRLSNKYVFLSRIFILVLTAKIAFSFFFATHYLRELFTPFVNYFVSSGFKNPWEYFHSLGISMIFPYTPLMLYIESIPRILFTHFLSSDWHVVSHLHLFVMRIPLLAFDVLMFYLFLKIFPAKKDIVLYVYWCFPIIFLINYIHGQLDIIPTAIFLLSTYFLINTQYFSSVILLALAAACKPHIFISLPFIFLFLYKREPQIARLISYLGLFTVTYVLLLFPYLKSNAFLQMVFNNVEQKRLFEFVLPLAPSVNLLLCPTAIFLLFLKFTSYRKLNKEIFLMFLGLSFAVPIILVNPAPGRVMWSLPFIIYFYISNKEFSRVPFLFYNLIYVVYFLLFHENKLIAQHTTLNLALINNLSISLLTASVAFILVWMYQIGVKRNEELKIKEKPLLIGIGGDSSCGKHKLFSTLENLLGKDKCQLVLGDDFHKWERGNKNWKVFTHLNPSGSKLHKEVESAIALKEGDEIETVEYNHNTGKFTNPKIVQPNKFIFFVGLHPFYLKSMREVVDIKIFIEADESLRCIWKIQRDTAERGYTKASIMEQINSRLEDSQKFIKPQKDFADLIIMYSPLSTIDTEKGTAKDVLIKTKYILSNSIDLEALLNNISQAKNLTVEHNNTSDLIHQELEVQGTISKEEITLIAQSLELNYDELLVNKPKWQSSFDGITQLIFLLVYNHKMKVK